MPASKTASPLPASSKTVFEREKAEAAEAVMQPHDSQPAGGREDGGRGVRVSGYLPVEIGEALRDEVIRRTVAQHRSVSFNDVLCSILNDWLARRRETA